MNTYKRRQLLLLAGAVLVLAGGIALALLVAGRDSAPSPAGPAKTGITGGFAPVPDSEDPTVSTGPNDSRSVDAGSFELELPASVGDVNVIGGEQNEVRFTVGKLPARVQSYQLRVGESLPMYATLFGPIEQAEKITVGGSRGYLFRQDTGATATFTAVAAKNGTAYTVQVYGRKGSPDVAKKAISQLAAALKLTPRAR